MLFAICSSFLATTALLASEDAIAMFFRPLVLFLDAFKVLSLLESDACDLFSTVGDMFITYIDKRVLNLKFEQI